MSKNATQIENGHQKKNRLELYDFLTSIDVSENIKDQIIDIFISNSLVNEKLFHQNRHGSVTEKNYFLIMSCLPWVKSVNGLNQQQTKKHKEKYQVPDFTLLVENNSNDVFPIYVEVKNCHTENDVRKIYKKQRTNLENYARDYKIDLLIATYWSKYKMWTHNSLSNFDSKNRITFFDAMKNDLSHIFHDQHIVIPPFSTKTYFNEIEGENSMPFGDKGFFQECLISGDNQKWNDIEFLQAVILDYLFTSKDQIKGNDEKGNYLLQTYTTPRMNKYTQLISAMISHITKDEDTIDEIIDKLEIIRVMTVDLCRKNPEIFTISYQIPDKRTSHTDHIFSLAYGNNWREISPFNSGILRESKLSSALSQALKI